MVVFSMSDMYYGWYSINDYGALSQNEKEFNANLAMSYLRRTGFTIYSAAGIVGNMWAESQMSPGQWQGNTPFSGGYGLVQWTPYTLYSDWAGNEWENNGPLEMQRLTYEKANGLEFYPSTTYPQWRWNNFAELAPTEGMTENDAVNLAASIFLHNYLRPASYDSESTRQYHARYVFEHCHGAGSMPIWMMFKMAKTGRGDFYG